MMQDEVSSSDELCLSQENFHDYFCGSLGDITVENFLPDGILSNCIGIPLLAHDEEEFDVPITSTTVDEPSAADGAASFFQGIELSHSSPGIMLPPPHTSFMGDHGFDIYFEPPKSRNNTWIYNKDRDKLYVTKDLAVPINFLGHDSIPFGAKIRTLGVFSQPKYMDESVRRCSNHIGLDLNDGKPAPYHLIQCQSKQAMYEEVNHVYTVVVPYERPQRGQSYSTYIYKFVCFGSCPGGLDRRPIKIIFQLEYLNSIIGQRCLELKICASPQRDSKNEEMKRQSATPSGHQSKKRRQTASAHVSDDDFSVDAPVEPMPIIKQELLDYAFKEFTVANGVPMIHGMPEVPMHPSCPPASNNYPGDYGFDVKFPLEKGKSFMYHSGFDKLYIAKDIQCAIAFTTQATLAPDMVVRVMPMFSLPDHAEEVVHRCPHHSQVDDAAGVFNHKHLIHCIYRDTAYFIDPVTERHSLIIPFHNIYNPGSTFVFKFCCLGSCPGGLNRRALKVIFTLEHNNIVYGRRSIHVKICASPQRDLKNDEKLTNAMKPPESSEPPPKKKKTTVQDPRALRDLFPTVNVMDTSDLDPLPVNKSSIYTITTTKYDEYLFMLEVLKRFRDPDASNEDSEVAESTTDESD